LFPFFPLLALSGGGRGTLGSEGAAYFSETAASRSARLLSILKRSFRAREKERAMVLRGDVR